MKTEKWVMSWKDGDGNFHSEIVDKKEFTEEYVAEIEKKFCCDIVIKKITVEE